MVDTLRTLPTHLTLEVVTPDRSVVTERVDEVEIPGADGYFGVLPGHAPLISSIRPGTIDVYEGQTVTRRIFVVSGIAEVTPERCTVLADEARPPDELDRGAIEAELQTVQGNLPSLREQVARATGAERDNLLIELRRLERQQNILQAELQALSEIAR